MNKELKTCRCKGIIVRGKRKGKRCGAIITYNTRYRTEPPQLCGSCDNLANETNYELQLHLDILEEKCRKSGLNFRKYRDYFLATHDFSRKKQIRLNPADLIDLGEYPHTISLE